MGPRAPWRAAMLAAAASAITVPSGRAEVCGPTPYECAVFYVGRQDFEAAIRSLGQELSRSPASLRALNLLGIALTGAGRIDEANRRFREALGMDEHFYPARKNLAVNEFTLQQDGQAESQLQRVLKDAPEDPVAHLYLAELRYRKKQFASALGHYEKTQAKFAERPEWILHFSNCLIERGRPKEAARVLGQLPERDAESQFQAGVALGRAGAFAEAASFFDRARRGYRDPYAAGYNQALMLIRSGHHAAAIRVGDELLAQGPAPAELYNLLSQAYQKLGRIQEAYDALRTATRIEPAAEENYLDLALLCLDYENYELGLEIADIGLHHRPDSQRLLLQRGVMLAMKGQVAQAEKEFETARKLAPDSAAAHVALAMAWMQTGQTTRAVEMLRERARLAGSDPMIAYMFGVALVRAGADPEGLTGVEAGEAFLASIRANPRFPAPRSELGKLLLKRGDVDHAILELEKAVALDPSDAGPAYVLAQAYRRQGQKARADEMLRRVTRLRSGGRSEDDPDAQLRRMVVRIIREGVPPPSVDVPPAR